MLNLTSYAGMEVVVTHTPQGAIDILAQRPFELIITRARIGQEDAAAMLTAHLQERGLDLPVLVIGEGVVPKGAAGPIKGSLDLRLVIKGAAQALKITAEQMAHKKVPDYYPLSARFFEWLSIPCCNVFSRDAEGNTAQIFPAGQAINKNIFTQLSRVSNGQFYVNKLDRLKMTDQITAELLAQLDEKDLNSDERIQASVSNMKLLAGKLVSMGITEETIALARKGMNSMAGAVKAYPQMGALLKRMLSNETGYLYRHTQIATYVALHIVRNIDWGTPEQEEKISFIAFFHDITLENEAQARVGTAEELRQAKFDPKTKDLVERHAQLSAELVHRYPHSPMGADQIIRQHHGMLNGVGYSDHFGANLSPMALVFLVAEEYTRIVLDSNPDQLDPKSMIKKLREHFPPLRIQKIIDLVQTITL